MFRDQRRRPMYMLNFITIFPCPLSSYDGWGTLPAVPPPPLRNTVPGSLRPRHATSPAERNCETVTRLHDCATTRAQIGLFFYLCTEVSFFALDGGRDLAGEVAKSLKVKLL